VQREPHGHEHRDPPKEHGGDRRRALGRRGEDLAAAHLGRLGFAVIARNVRSRHGEIDLIACDGDTLVFVEVKSRRARPDADPQRGAPDPLSWLRARQRARLRRLAAAWLSVEHDRPHVREIRFDAVGVILDDEGELLRLDHVEHAW
jgi:putative endonuclease